jgi:TRAP-type C4-dicarboxylate transport system permease small subunit
VVRKYLQHVADGVAAAILAAMFLTFVIQVFSRYVMSNPMGWTLELCLTLWLWLVFWGNAFVVRDRDHVTFDIVYLMSPRKLRQVLATVSALAIATGLAVSILPTWDYIDFMKIKKSATLHIPMRTVFSIYALFLGAIVLRNLWRVVQIWRDGKTFDADRISETSEP